PTYGESLRTHTEKNHALENPDHFFRARWFSSRPNDTGPGVCGRQTSVHVRGHDEIETRRRAGAVARRKVGRVRCRRCRSRREQKNLASLDRTGGGWGSAPVESNAES